MAVNEREVESAHAKTERSASWAAALSAFEAARAAEDAYDQAEWRPVYQEWVSRRAKIPDHIEAEMARLADARYASEDALMKAPAPSLSVAIWKMEYARERWDECWPDNYWDDVISDLRRFAATEHEAQTSWDAEMRRIDDLWTAYECETNDDLSSIRNAEHLEAVDCLLIDRRAHSLSAVERKLSLILQTYDDSSIPEVLLTALHRDVVELLQ